MTNQHEKHDLQAALEIDRCCDEFEDALLAGKAPSIRDALRSIDAPQRERLFEQLLKIEAEHQGSANREFWKQHHKQFPNYTHVITRVALEIEGRKESFADTVNQTTAGLPPVSANRPVSQSKPIGKFGGYQLLREIARGGMGVVYEARQEKANRIVALKMILSGNLASEEEKVRFFQEAQAAANLDHVNIVPVYEVGEHEGQQYFSLGFVKGESLSQRLENGPLAVPKAMELIRGVTAGVAYAHSRGIIHRDIKPSNILLDEQDSPKVVDFGLAKNLHVDSGLTATGQVLGTPSYMPPEQAKGADANPACDVYSIGATLYHMLTGNPPFRGANLVETLNLVANNEPVPPRRQNPLVDRDVETICLKCLAKDPAKRYASAEELQADIQRWETDKPIVARPTGRIERVFRWCKRNPVVAGLALFAIVALVAGSTISTYLALLANQRAIVAESSRQQATQQKMVADQQRAVADRERERAKKQRNLAIAGKDAAERQLYLNRIQRAHTEWRAGNAAAAWQQWNACPPHLRGWEHRYLYSLFTTGQRTVQTAKGLRGLNGLSVSEDGRRILCKQHSWVEVWDRGKEDFLPKPGGGRGMPLVSCADMMSDGSRFVTGSADGTLRTWNPSDGKLLTSWQGHQNGVTTVAVSRGGARIASGDRDGKIKIWIVGSDTPFRELDHQAEIVDLLFVNREGKLLAAVDRNGQVKLWDVESKEALWTKDGDWGCVAASRNGRMIAAGSHFGKVRLWNAQNGQELRTIRSHHSRVRAVAFSRNEEFLACCGDRADNTIRLWNTESGDEYVELVGHRGEVRDLEFGPVSLMSVGDGGELKIWDHRKVRQRRQGYTNSVHAIDFDRTGEQFLTIWGVKSVVDGLTKLSYGYSPSPSDVAFDQEQPQRVVMARRDKVTIWDPAKKTGQDFVPSGTAHHVAVRPRGSQFASAGPDHRIDIWNYDGSRLRTLDTGGTYVGFLVYHPQGNRLVAGISRRQGSRQQSELVVWDADSGKELKRLGPFENKGFRCATFDATGEQILLGLDGGLIEVRNFATGEIKHSWHAHAERVYGMALSPDGERVATVGVDQLVKVWLPKTGELVISLRGHRQHVSTVAFSPDGAQLLSGGSDGLRIWDANHDAGVYRSDSAMKELQADGFHRYSARLAKRWGDWHARVFHLRILATLEPDDSIIKAQLEEALQQSRSGEKLESADSPSPESTHN